MPFASREKQKEYQKKWHQRVVKKRRAAWFREHGPCANCGSRRNLELHHINPETKVSHKVWSWSEKRRNEELAKCIPLCHACHKERTREQRAKALEHGTRAGYMEFGCRCPACTAAASEYRNKQRYRTGTRRFRPTARTPSLYLGDLS